MGGSSDALSPATSGSHDAIAGGARPAAAPGKRALTDRLPPRTSRTTPSASPAGANDQPDEGHDDSAARPPAAQHALHVIEAARDAFIKLKKRSKTETLARDSIGQQATAKVRQVIDAVAALAPDRASHGHGIGVVTSQFLPLAAHPDDETLASARAFLDSITADTLEIAMEANEDVRRGLIAELAALERQSAALGWKRPPDLDDARTRKYDHEPCPFGDDSPRACDLTDGKRATTIDEVRDVLNTVCTNFFAACQRKADALQRAIDADQKLAEHLTGIVVDVVLVALTGPLATAASDRLMRPSRLSPAFSKFAGDIGKTLLKNSSKTPAALGARSKLTDGRGRTIEALGALEAQFHADIEDVKSSMRTLDDLELLELRDRIEALKAHGFDAEVERYAAAYRTQIAPIGLEDDGSENLFDGGWYRADKKATARAARIVMPGGGERMALVEEITDRKPGVTRAARGALVAAERVLGDADDDPFTGRMTRDRQEAWVDSPSLELHFVRWIDDERMQAMAADGAQPVPASRVLDLPLASLASGSGR